MRTPLLVAHCVRRIRGLQNIVPLQRARRCGLRVAFVASECRRLSLLCSAHAAVGCALLCRIRMRGMSLLCIAYSTNITNTTKVPSRGSHGSSNAYAAVGCALRSSHSRASKYRVRRCWLRIAFVASAGFKISSLCSAHAAVGCVLPSSHPNAEDFRYRVSFCWRNPPCRWTQPCQVVEFNYQFMSKVCYIFNMNWEWSSGTAADAGWHIRP